MAEILCEVLGVDPDLVIVIVDAETTAGLFGWSIRKTGGYRFDRAPLLDYPLVVLDEFDKPRGVKQEATYKLLQARTWVSRSGEKIHIAPAVMVLMNRPHEAVLKDEFLRRSVCFDTAAVAQAVGLDRLQGRMEDARRAILGVGAFGRLELGGLGDPGPLPDGVYRLMREAVFEGLNERGRELRT
jgi:hypothetical protein